MIIWKNEFTVMLWNLLHLMLTQILWIDVNNIINVVDFKVYMIMTLKNIAVFLYIN